MATPTLADLEVIAPALAGDSRAETFLAMAIRRHAAESPTWGAVYSEAMCYYAAHRLLKAIEADNAATSLMAGGSSSVPAGPVTSRTAGRVSETYSTVGAASGGSVGSMTAADADLMTTQYGRAYLELRNDRAPTSAFLALP